jgi:hypothetical protein
MARADFPNDEAWLRSLGIDRETNPNNPSSWKPDLQARWTDHINTLAPERQAKLTVERPGVVVRPIGEDLNTIPANGPTSPEESPNADGSRFSSLQGDYQPTEEERAAGAAFYSKFNTAYGPYGRKVDAKKAKAELQANFPVVKHFDELSEAHSSIRAQLSKIPNMYVGNADLPATAPDNLGESDKPKAQALLDRAREIRSAQKTLSSKLSVFKQVGVEPPRDQLPPSLRFDHLLAPVGGTAPAGIDDSDWANLTPEAHKLALDYIDKHNEFAKNHLDDQGRIKVNTNRAGIDTNDPLHNTGGLDKYHELHDIRQKIEKEITVSGRKTDKEDAELKVASALKNYPYGLIRSVNVAPRTNPVTDAVQQPSVEAFAPDSPKGDLPVPSDVTTDVDTRGTKHYMINAKLGMSDVMNEMVPQPDNGKRFGAGIHYVAGERLNHWYVKILDHDFGHDTARGLHKTDDSYTVVKGAEDDPNSLAEAVSIARRMLSHKEATRGVWPVIEQARYVQKLEDLKPGDWLDSEKGRGNSGKVVHVPNVITDKDPVIVERNGAQRKVKTFESLGARTATRYSDEDSSITSPTPPGGNAVNRSPRSNPDEQATAEYHIRNYVNTYKSILNRVGRTVGMLSSGDMAPDERNSLRESLDKAGLHYRRSGLNDIKADRLVKLHLKDMPLNPEFARDKNPFLQWHPNPDMLDQ